jgi:hypothetical protein
MLQSVPAAPNSEFAGRRELAMALEGLPAGNEFEVTQGGNETQYE